jgi:transposase
VKIDVYSYKGFRDSILGDRLIKLINLMLRSAECGFYHYQIEIKPRVSEIERRTVAAGRFILATNIESSSDLHCSEILWNYKNQQSCERGFRFLKEPQFFADSFFVKKPERVETILFIMSLCLLVYNLGQRELRKTLL